METLKNLRILRALAKKIARGSVREKLEFSLLLFEVE